MRRPPERRGRVRGLESVVLVTRRQRKDGSKVGSLRRHPLDAPAVRIERAPSEGYAHRAKRIDLLTAPAMRIEWAPSESYAHTAERLYAHKTNLEPPGLCA